MWTSNAVLKNRLGIYGVCVRVCMGEREREGVRERERERERESSYSVLRLDDGDDVWYIDMSMGHHLEQQVL